MLQALSNEHHIYHSLRWIAPREAEPATEGEIDLLIYHEHFGLLALEVKGGAVSRSGAVWYYENGTPMRESPLSQVERARGKLSALLKSMNLPAAPIAVGALLPGASLAEAPEGYLDGARRDRLAEWVRALLQSKGRVAPHQERKLLSQDGEWRAPRSEKRAVFDALFNRKSSYQEPLSLALSRGERTLVVLSDLQARVATELLLSMGARTATCGRAGTGKTEVALHLGCTLARRGLKTLLLCFNRHLSEALARRVEALGLPPGRLEVSTIDYFARRHAARVGLELPAEETFDPDRTGDILCQLARDGRSVTAAHTYDALIIDEGQDMNADQLLDLMGVIFSDLDAARVHLFYDDRQALFQEERSAIEDLIAALELHKTRPFTVNYRNPRRVAVASGALLCEEVETPESAPEGEQLVIRVGGERELSRRVRELIEGEGLTPRDIVLLSPRGDGGALAERRRLAELELIHAKEQTSYERWRADQGLLVTTARAFKGLEAKVALLYDLGGFSERYTHNDLYVGLTRATGRVEVFAESPEAAAALKELLQREVSHERGG